MIYLMSSEILSAESFGLRNVFQHPLVLRGSKRSFRGHSMNVSEVFRLPPLCFCPDHPHLSFQYSEGRSLPSRNHQHAYQNMKCHCTHCTPSTSRACLLHPNNCRSKKPLLLFFDLLRIIHEKLSLTLPLP